MPRTSTKRTDGRPSGDAVASATPSGSGTPASAASASQLRACASGVGGEDNSEVHRDVLDLEVLVDALGAALAPEAGLLHAAERRRGGGQEALVGADHPGLEPLHDPEGALDVAREDVGDEAVLRVVGGGDGGLLVVEGRDGRDRTEDLLLEQARLDGHA